VGTDKDKISLFELLYEACSAVPGEKATAYQRFYVEVDRVRAGTPFSRQQVKELLYRDGYLEFCRRKRIAERNGL
jgi:hypothetical protein